MSEDAIYWYYECAETFLPLLEARGGILWEQGKEGIEGWAICPKCEKRSLHVLVFGDTLALDCTPAGWES